MKKLKKREEHFKITPQQKAELGLLAIKLKGISTDFNLHTFLLRRKKLKGYFPPADKVIKVCREIIRRRDIFKDSNLWPYLTTAINREQRLSFAELNIKENESFKGMKPIETLINPALIKNEI